MSGVIALNYFCYQCQANTNVFRAPIPICVTCNSRFVEKIREDNENEWENGEPDQISEELNSRLSFQLCREQGNDNNSNSSSSTDEPVTDDGDENYEDIDEYEEDDEDEEDNDDDDDEDDDDSDLEFQPWRRYYDEDYSEDEEEIFLNPWRRYYRRATEEDSVAQNDGLDDNNSLLTEVDQDHYLHHDYHHHSHLHSDVIPMVEHLLSTLSARVEGLHGDDSEHPLSSMLQNMLHNLDSPVQRVAASSEQIEKLEKRKLQDGDIDVETECIICQDIFGIDAELIKMPCKHEYHGKCIRHWLSVSTTCPMCRSSLPADERLPPCPPSEDGEPQHQNERNGTSHRARTFTFQSPAGSTTVGILVADPNALPPGLQHLDPHYVENEAEDYHENDDDNDNEFDNDSYDYDGSHDEFDENHNEVDDEDDLLRNFGHPILRMCPHGFPHPVIPTLRQNLSTTTTRREQQQNPRQFNPMDEVD